MRRDGDAICGVAVFELNSRIDRTHVELCWHFLRRKWNREPVLDVALLLGSRFHSRLRRLSRCNRALSNATPFHRANGTANRDQCLGTCDLLLNGIRTALDCISTSDVLNCWDKQTSSLGDSHRPSFQPRNPITNRSIEGPVDGAHDRRLVGRTSINFGVIGS